MLRFAQFKKKFLRKIDLHPILSIISFYLRKLDRKLERPIANYILTHYTEKLRKSNICKAKNNIQTSVESKIYLVYFTSTKHFSYLYNSLKSLKK